MRRKILRSIARRETGLDPLYSIQEAADLTGLSHWTLRKWAKDGKIETNKQGSRRLISESELERLLEEGRRPALTA